MNRTRADSGWLPWGLWLLLVAGSALIVINAPPLNTDLTQFFTDQPDPARQTLARVLERSAGSRIIVIRLQSDDAERARSASAEMKSKLEENTGIARVYNGSQLLSSDDVDRLFEYRYLLEPDDFSNQALRTALQARLAELTSPIGLIENRQRLLADPTVTTRKLIQRLARTGGTNSSADNSVWYSSKFRSALLLAISSAATHELDALEQTVIDIHQTFSEISGTTNKQCIIDSAKESADSSPASECSLRLGLTGAPVFALQSRQIIRDDARLLSIAGSVGVALLLFIAFRSIPLMLLVALPLASGILVGMASVLLLFDSMHGITLVFGITLIGISVDYPIHLFSHGRRDQGSNPVWKPMTLGAVTTALGFAPLVFSDFPALSQLAVFSLSGIIAALLVTRYLLPHFSQPTPPVNDIRPPTLPPFTHRAALPVATIVISVAALGLNQDKLWQVDINQLNPVPQQARQLDGLLKAESGAPDTGRMLILNAQSLEQLLILSEDISRDLESLVVSGALSDFVAASEFLPSSRTQYERQRALPTRERIQANLDQALAGLPFRKQVFQQFVDDVEASTRLAPLTLKELSGTVFESQLERFIFNRDGHWYGMISLSGINQEKALEALAVNAGQQVEYLNIARQSQRILDDYRAETLRLVMLGMTVIALILVAATGIRAATRILLPVFAALALTVTLLVLLGSGLSLFHVAALLLVLGIGLDYAVFIQRSSLGSPHFAATARSLIVCNLSTVLLFSLLAISSAPVLSAMGVTIVIGALLALFFSSLMISVD